MSSTEDIPEVVTTADAQSVLDRTFIFLRMTPVTGSDEEQAAAWRQSVKEFLDSSVVTRALKELGLSAPAGGPPPTEDPTAFLASLRQRLDADGDDPISIAAMVAATVGGMVVSYLAGYDFVAQPGVGG